MKIFGRIISHGRESGRAKHYDYSDNLRHWSNISGEKRVDLDTCGDIIAMAPIMTDLSAGG